MAHTHAGTWRGLPVAVKTMVFEAWEGESDGGAVSKNKAELRYLRAVMETAISASIGHMHVVRGVGPLGERLSGASRVSWANLAHPARNPCCSGGHLLPRHQAHGRRQGGGGRQGACCASFGEGRKGSLHAAQRRLSLALACRGRECQRTQCSTSSPLLQTTALPPSTRSRSSWCRCGGSADGHTRAQLTITRLVLTRIAPPRLARRSCARAHCTRPCTQRHWTVRTRRVVLLSSSAHASLCGAMALLRCSALADGALSD